MITMQIKTLFFDKPTVLRAVDKAQRAGLSKAGAFIRTAAKRSIRTKQGSAPPGRPPHSHTGLLKRFIFFGYDPTTESVVVGPARVNRTTDAPHTLEFGGTTTIKRRRKGKVCARGVRVAPRPFMGPALEKERLNLPKTWANSVRGG